MNGYIGWGGLSTMEVLSSLLLLSMPFALAMAESSREAEEKPSSERTPDYTKLLEYGLDKRIAGKLDDIFKTGKLLHKDLDDRALDALKEYPSEGAIAVLNQFLESNLEHVSNKSAFLCGIMKTYRQKSRSGMAGVASTSAVLTLKGPDEEKIKAVLERTGYSLDVTTGQRKYGGPPPNWQGPAPGVGCEVFCGKIPRDVYEDELIVLFEKCGTIYDLRLMMDPLSGTNRGYAFVTYTSRDQADLDNYEIKPGKTLKVNISVPNLRLFVGNIPKSKSREEIFEEFNKLTTGLSQVIIYSSPDDNKKNRGFCFLEYDSHKSASLAKKRLATGRLKVWGCDIIVKVLYVRNLTQYCTEEKLKEAFEQYGRVERVKRIKDYAFVHFEDRQEAITAMNELNGQTVAGSTLEVSLAKPPSDKKKKEEILRNRERRMMQMMQGRGGPGPSGAHAPLLTGPPMPRGSVPLQAALSSTRMGRGDYDSDYFNEDYYYPNAGGETEDPYLDVHSYGDVAKAAHTFMFNPNMNVMCDTIPSFEPATFGMEDDEDEELRIMKSQLKSFSSGEPVAQEEHSARLASVCAPLVHVKEECMSDYATAREVDSESCFSMDDGDCGHSVCDNSSDSCSLCDDPYECGDGKDKTRNGRFKKTRSPEYGRKLNAGDKPKKYSSLYSRFSEDQAAGGFYDEHELWDPGWARTWGNTPWAGWWAPGSANWGAGGRLRGPWGPGPRSSWVPRQSKFSR
ncbi:hypothetical protein M8J75_001866 [Diaphorina citri]|nr:hypothetical protein M8J75_001866 [Diaphorina citri]